MTDRRLLSPARRKEIAQLAAAARWGKRKPQIMHKKPLSMHDLEHFCNKMALSCNLPPEYYDKPTGTTHAGLDILEIAAARALHVIQLGREVGLQPAQSLASISVKYGNPLIKGDAQLALVINSGKAEYVKEYTDGGELYVDGVVNSLFSAVCEVLRIGDAEPHFSRFSVQDATTAELWGKPGAWQTHKPRMLKYKARAFGLRDKFPDVLKGLTHTAEEMEGETLGRRSNGTDIAPPDAAQKLTGILDDRMLHNTRTGTEGEKPHD